MSNVTATASSELYYVNQDNILVYDRRAAHVVDFTGLCCGNPPEHAPGEGGVWESVGNGYVNTDSGIPYGHDSAPWIQFTFPSAHTISSIYVWNFGEVLRSAKRIQILANGSTSLGTFTLNTGINSYYRTERQILQFSNPVTASSFKFVMLENGAGTNFPTSGTGLNTLVGLGEVQFNILPADLKPTLVGWDTTLGGVRFAYTNQGGALTVSTTAKLFWANGTTMANILSSTPIFTHNIPVGFSGQSANIHIPGSLLHDGPTDTTHMLLVIDRENLVTESSEANNTLALADVTVIPKNGTVNMAVLSSYTIGAIKDSLRRAAELQAIVNSTKRTIREQAEAVCGNIQKPGKGLSKQKLLYGANPPMTAALQAYEDSLTNTPPPNCADVLTASLEASVAGGAQLGSISKHLGDYSQLQAVDVSYNNAVNKQLLWSAFLANPKISKTIGPPNDPALHIEIPQVSPQIQLAGHIVSSGNTTLATKFPTRPPTFGKSGSRGGSEGPLGESEAGDIPDCVSNPTPLQVADGLDTISGTVSTGHVSFSFEASSGDLLNVGVNVTGYRPGSAFADADSMVFLVDNSCTLLASNDDTDVFVTEMESAIQNFLIPSNGTYYVVVTTFENMPILTGLNTISGWQDNGGSDLDFDLSVALLHPVLDIQTITNGQVRISWGVAATLEESASLDGPWVEVSGAVSPFVIQTTNQSKFFRYRRY